MEVTILWKEEGRREGLQQGLEQGLEKGRQEGMLSVITHQIERRLGPIDAGTLRRIGELSPDQLERLGDDLLDFTSAEDLARWLRVG